MSHVQQNDGIALTPDEAFMRVVETLPGALFLVDEATNIVYANTLAQTLTATSAADLYGYSLWQSAPQFICTPLYQAVQQAQLQQELTEVEYASPITGEWLHVQISPAAAGLILQFQTRKAPPPYQKSLLSPSQLPSVVSLEGLHAGIAVLTTTGILLETNEELLEDMQLQRAEVIGMPLINEPWWSFSSVAPEYVQTALARACSGEPAYFEALIFLHEEKPIDLQVTIAPHMDEHSHIDYLVFIGLDITNHTSTKEGVHLPSDDTLQFIWAARPDGYVTYISQSGRNYTGMAAEQLQGDGWLRYLHPDDRQSTWKAWHSAVQTNTSYEIEYRLYSSVTGQYRWFLARGRPIIEEHGAIMLWVGTCTDIDDRKRMEAALRHSQDQVQALMNSPIIGIILVKGEKIIEANDTFLAMTGYTREELQAGTMYWTNMTPPEYMARTKQAHREFMQRQSMTPFEKEYICKDGNRLPVLVGGISSKEHPDEYVSFVLDNSARKELEQRKDDFISMASHELRTPLTALKLQVNRLKRKWDTQNLSDLDTTLASMEAQINKATGLIEGLLDVSKIQEGKLVYHEEMVDLNALLQEIIETLQHINPSHHIVMQGIVQCCVPGDHDRLGQVFINLINNAIKYSPTANTVDVYLCTTTEVVTVGVRDYGPGIPREQHDKIFKRFYRTAETRQQGIPGLGMGLYIVAEIVKHHQGTITIDSEIGKGSTFIVTLPIYRTISAQQ